MFRIEVVDLSDEAFQKINEVWFKPFFPSLNGTMHSLGILFKLSER